MTQAFYLFVPDVWLVDCFVMFGWLVALLIAVLLACLSFDRPAEMPLQDGLHGLHPSKLDRLKKKKERRRKMKLQAKTIDCNHIRV